MPETKSRRASQHAWYVANRERILADRRRHYAENRERIIARVAAYRASHKEEVAEWNRIYRERVGDARRAQQRGYMRRRGYLLRLNRWVNQRLKEVARDLAQ